VEYVDKMFNVSRETCFDMVIQLPSEIREDFDQLKRKEILSCSFEDVWPKLEIYLYLLSRWSKKVSLVSRQDWPVLATKHLRQALMMVPVVASSPRRLVMDLGSGAGFPAIPLKIALPDSYFMLVESRRKRAHFLREVVRSVGLDRIEVVNDRIENLNPVGADLVTARAVASPDKLLDLVRRHLSPHGWILSTLGKDAAHSELLAWKTNRMGSTLGLFH
jgi:16S rRNA (guanine527-N7)-methyltransferase